VAHYILGGLDNAGRQGMALTGEPTVVNGNPLSPSA
jgi:hypothetical protein